MTKRPSVVVDVQIATGDSAVPAVDDMESWILCAVAGSGRTLAGDREVSVRVVGREEMRRLNRDYRGQDKATNVLSFPNAGTTGLPADATGVLGDIVVCAAVVGDEAAHQGKPVNDHWAHMLVHGTLHLLGFDHEAQADALQMEALEARILASQGLEDPYAKR